ncbi:MAG: hypothetical protein COT43_04180 [Candidatus Marinimicrobia bacterium CG08_land_8_20_14_0_20_45_22]|nr:MAG: hypothetical protein COT43_04180 [Candidatus Marinimicrobia bacterium CG08_land_8_20_14_0_20_45_22]
MSGIKIVLSILLSFLLNISAFSEAIPITVQVKIDTTIATIGDRIQMTIGLSYPEGTRFQFPFIEKTLGETEVVGNRFSEPEKIDGGLTQTWTLDLAVFDTGIVTIPPLEIRALSPSDTTAIMTFKTDPQKIRIISVLPAGETNLKDIKPPFPIRRTLPLRLLVFLIILMGLSYGAWKYYQKWKREHPPLALDERFLEAPHVAAFRKLEQLKGKTFKTVEEQMQYYSEISQIIREYIERRYFIRALELTTTEIIIALCETDVDETTQLKVGILLKELDVIKFARQIPTTDRISSVWSNAWKFVDKTKREYFLTGGTSD